MQLPLWALWGFFGSRAHCVLPCTCDCCAVAFPGGNAVCAPYKSLVLSAEEKRAAKNCPTICGSTNASFFSHSRVDASRFCLDACLPVSLVGADRVITAGHCCDGQSASRLGVRVGSHNLYEDDPDQADIAVSKVLNHEDYDSWTITN